MYCNYCGLAIRQGAHFCKSCGKRQGVTVSSGSPSGNPQLIAPKTGSTATVWALLLLLLITPVLFVIFHLIPAIILFVLSVFWLLVFPHVGIAGTKKVLIGTAVALVVALGLQAYQAHSEREDSLTMQHEVPATTTPQGLGNPASQTPPPKFHVFKFKTDVPTSYVVPVKTSDEELKSLLWLFRQSVRAGDFKKIGITQPTATRWGKLGYTSGMLVVFRGEKCANEDYISDAQIANGKLGPCGYGDHDDGIYQWGINGDPVKDSGQSLPRMGSQRRCSIMKTTGTHLPRFPKLLTKK